MLDKPGNFNIADLHTIPSQWSKVLVLLCIIVLSLLYTPQLLAQRTFDSDSVEQPLDSLNNPVFQNDSIKINSADPNSTDGFLEKDTLDVPLRISQVQYTTDLEFGNWQMPDTNITNQQYYLPTETPFNEFKRMGSLGMHHYPVLFQPNTSLKFNWGYNNLNQYPRERRYFQANYPLSKAEYITGTHKEQFFHVMHTQNINPFLNVLVDYQVAGAEGLYQNQKTNAQNLILGTSFQTKNKRYQNHLTYQWNRYKLEQNGGVNDPNLDLASSFAKIGLSVNLTNARHDNVDRTATMWHSFDFGFTKSREDSATIKKMVPKIVAVDTTSATPMIDALLSGEAEDSLSNQVVDSSNFRMDTTMVEIEKDTFFMVKDFYPAFRLFHEFKFINDKHHYGDSQFFDFYPNTFYSENSTDDTLIRNQVVNEVGVLFLGKNFIEKDTSDTRLRAKASLVHEYARLNTLNTAEIGTYVRSRKIGNLFAQFKFFNQRDKLHYFLNLEKGISGRNASGWNAKLKLNYQFSFANLGLEYLTNRQAPDYVYTDIATNHHQWYNSNLRSIAVNKITGTIGLFEGDLAVSFSQYLVDNYIYFNQLQEVNQLSNQLSIQQASISGKANRGRWYGQGTLVFQNANSRFLPIPNLMLNGSVWYENKIFQSMWIEIGTMFEYNSNYFTPLFAPSMEQFYWQDQEEATFYPQFDLFINARVRTVRFIVRSQNLTADLFQAANPTYVNGYPMLDRGVKLGVTWWFFD